MAKTAINELVETIKLVRTMKETVADLVDVAENLNERVMRLEQSAREARPPSE